jgi:hypothetical protein
MAARQQVSEARADRETPRRKQRPVPRAIVRQGRAATRSLELPTATAQTLRTMAAHTRRRSERSAIRQRTTTIEAPRSHALTVHRLIVRTRHREPIPRRAAAIPLPRDPIPHPAAAILLRLALTPLQAIVAVEQVEAPMAVVAAEARTAAVVAEAHTPAAEAAGSLTAKT